MNNNASKDGPLISICIPTYNRASNLENLFRSLKPIKEAQCADIEICLSNNNSSDNTDEIIDSWKALLDLKVVRQSVNIGGTLNAIEVTKHAKGHWIQIIGDDDALCPIEFNEFMKLLKTTPLGTWILVGVASKEVSHDVLLGDLFNGHHSSESFRTTILRTGLYRFGFIGMHIIPAVWLPTFHRLTFNSTQGWPHLALFIRYLLEDASIVIHKKAIIAQAVGTDALFWKTSDWARVSLGKIDVISFLKTERKQFHYLLNLMILRELYAPTNLKNLILWKTLETIDFNTTAPSEYEKRYHSLGGAAIFSIWHYLFLVLILITPSSIIQFTLKAIGRGKTINEYRARMAAMADYDGVKRVL